MSKRNKRYIQTPRIGEPLENPNFVVPTGLTGITEVPGFHTPTILTDPLGSWTGQPTNLHEEPVQDADDL